jgi:cytosine/adenosine deaminase-related metal-dependent hydrolase
VPYPPLWTIYHFVTRDTITGGVLGGGDPSRSPMPGGGDPLVLPIPGGGNPLGLPKPDQRISRQAAIRLATINNAWLMFEEQTKGSIEPGKLADLVVLSEDPLTCPEPRLRDARVLLTMVGGRIVYGSDRF